MGKGVNEECVTETPFYHLKGDGFSPKARLKILWNTRLTAKQQNAKLQTINNITEQS